MGNFKDWLNLLDMDLFSNLFFESGILVGDIFLWFVFYSGYIVKFWGFVLMVDGEDSVGNLCLLKFGVWDNNNESFGFCYIFFF